MRGRGFDASPRLLHRADMAGDDLPGTAFREAPDARVLRPAITENRSQRIKVLAHLLQLVAAEQVHMRCVGTQEEADMAFPAAWFFARQDNDATGHGLIERFSPFEPGTRQRRACARDADLSERPVHKRRAPGRLVIVATDAGVFVVRGDARVALAWRECANADFRDGNRHPGRELHLRANDMDRTPAEQQG